MKKAIIIFTLAGSMLTTFTACNSNSTNKEVHKKKGKYTCTMHPNVSADKPGLCPKCGMELVERDTTADK